MNNIAKTLFIATLIVVACENKKDTTKEDLVISSFQEFVSKSPDFKVNSVEIISIKEYDTISISKIQDYLKKFFSYQKQLQQQADSLNKKLISISPSLSYDQKSRTRPFVVKFMEAANSRVDLLEELMLMSDKIDMIESAQPDSGIIMAINYQPSKDTDIETYYALSSYDGKSVSFSKDPEDFGNILSQMYRDYNLLNIKFDAILDNINDQYQTLNSIFAIIETSN